MQAPGPSDRPTAPDQDGTALPFVAPCRTLTWLAPFRWLELGWRDLWSAPALSLGYGVLLAGGGALLALLTWRLGVLALYFGLASGFVFIGPVLAMGLYSVSSQI